MFRTVAKVRQSYGIVNESFTLSKLCFHSKRGSQILRTANSGKESACQCRRCKKWGFNPWIGKIPWRRARQPTPVFLPGESPWTEEPGGRQHMGSQRVWHNWLTKHRAQQRVKSRLRREKHRKILVLKGNVYCSFSPLEGPCHIGNLDEKRASCKLTTALS